MTYNPKLLITAILCMVLGLTSKPASAQVENHLILKKGYKNKIHYLIGDEIRFTDIRSDVPVIGAIQEIGEDFITVNKMIYPLNEIQTVVYRRKGFNYEAGGQMLKIAGPGLILVGLVNYLIQQTLPVWSLGNLVAAALITTTGFILPRLQDRVFGLGERYYLRIVPSDPALQQAAGR